MKSASGFGRFYRAITNTTRCPATRVSYAFSGVAYAGCGGATWFVAVNARSCDGIVSPHCWTGGFPSPEFCILIPINASTLAIILGKSRMRRRARTDLCGGRSAMGVPTATLSVHPEINSAELRNQATRSGSSCARPLRPRASSRNDCANFVPNVRERSYLNVTFSMRVLRGN